MIAKEGLLPLFDKSVAELTPQQESLIHWLRYYDSFYESLAYTSHDCDVKPWMVIYDNIVECYFVWKEWFDEEEHKRLTRTAEEAHPPTVEPGQTQYSVAFQ